MVCNMGSANLKCSEIASLRGDALNVLLFHIGDDAYGIDTATVIEIGPCARVRVLPHALPGLSGILNWHGQSIPVIDAHLLLGARAAQPYVSTRMIIIGMPTAAHALSVCALIAERVAGPVAVTAVRTAGPLMNYGPFLGPLISDGRRHLPLFSPRALWDDITSALAPIVNLPDAGGV